MRLKLCEAADVSQGSILTRIKAVDKEGIKAEAITMQELSYYCNQSDEKPSANMVFIRGDRYDNCLFSNVGDVLVGLSSGNAMVIEKERENKLILSNFAVIKANPTVIDPYYLCWMLNEDNSIKKQLAMLYQRTSRVVVIPISTFKDIELDCCDINKQILIGKSYNLVRRKARLSRRKAELGFELTNLRLMNKNKGE